MDGISGFPKTAPDDAIVREVRGRERVNPARSRPTLYCMLNCWGWRFASLFQKNVTGREIPGVFPSGLL